MAETEKYKLIILGGGVSGLLCGYFAKQKAIDFRIFEAKKSLGGWVQSESKDDFLFEWGPHSILADQEWQEMFNDLGIEPIQRKPKVHKRFIFKRNKARALPLGPLSFLFGSFFSWREKCRIVWGLFKSLSFEKDVSVHDFFSQLLGESFASTVISSFIHGVYAGDSKRLSASACFPELFDHIQSGGRLVGLILKHRSRKVPVSFSGGLSTFVQSLSERLKDQISSSQKIRLVRFEEGHFVVETNQQTLRCERLIFALPASELGNLARSIVTEPAALFLKSIPYQRTAVWNTYWNRPKNFEPGYGCLLPPKENRGLLGSLWPSEMFDGRCPKDRLVTAQYFSGSGIPDDPMDELGLLQSILGTKDEPLKQDFKVFDQAIPQFELNHRDHVRSLKSSLNPHMAIAGNFLSGVGLTACFSEAKEAVTKLFP